MVCKGKALTIALPDKEVSIGCLSKAVLGWSQLRWESSTLLVVCWLSAYGTCDSCAQPHQRLPPMHSLLSFAQADDQSHCQRWSAICLPTCALA